MESGRKKIKICLACILLAAVVVGICYYYNSKTKYNDMEGTLIQRMWEGRHVC